MRCTKNTNSSVPMTARMNAKIVLTQSPIAGKNSIASAMPNCADWIVAPVVGETNLFMHSCCMIRPATLMPTPVQMMASRRGILPRKNIFISIPSPPASSVERLISVAPTNSDAADNSSKTAAKIKLDRYFLIKTPPKELD